MNCLSEAIGMGLVGNGTIPAVSGARLRLAKQAGIKVIGIIVRESCSAGDHDLAAVRNAMTVDMALVVVQYGSTSPAIAHEAGIDLSLALFDEITETPHLCKSNTQV